MLDELATYRKMLPINRHRLDDELAINSEIQDHIGRQVAHSNTRLLDQKRRLDEIEARLFDELKLDSKMTNPQVEREIKRNPEWRKQWVLWQSDRETHEQWESLYKAWITRSYDLKALCELHGQQYFALESVRGPYPTNMESLRGALRDASTKVDRTRQQATEPERPRRRSLVDS